MDATRNYRDVNSEGDYSRPGRVRQFVATVLAIVVIGSVGGLGTTVLLRRDENESVKQGQLAIAVDKINKRIDDVKTAVAGRMDSLEKRTEKLEQEENARTTKEEAKNRMQHIKAQKPHKNHKKAVVQKHNNKDGGQCKVDQQPAQTQQQQQAQAPVVPQDNYQAPPQYAPAPQYVAPYAPLPQGYVYVYPRYYGPLMRGYRPAPPRMLPHYMPPHYGGMHRR
jgi:hypothetical protein